MRPELASCWQNGMAPNAIGADAINLAIARLDEAEAIDPGHAPSALYEERARYHAALGKSGLAATDRAAPLPRIPTSTATS